MTIDLDAIVNEIDERDARDLGVDDIGDLFMIDDEAEFITPTRGTRRVVRHRELRSFTDRPDAYDYPTYNFDER